MSTFLFIVQRIVRTTKININSLEVVSVTIGKVTKTALAVVLLMGQVTPPAANYYEDDGDFNTVSTGFSTGWGWGLNKAYADCDDISDYSAAQACKMERIRVEGEQITYEDTFEFPDDPFDGGYTGEDIGGTYSGGGDIEAPSSNVEMTTAECVVMVSAGLADCEKQIKDAISVGQYTCNTLGAALATSGTPQGFLSGVAIGAVCHFGGNVVADQAKTLCSAVEDYQHGAMCDV
jgi:hypothetical protein